VVFWRQHPCLLWSNIPGWMSPTEVHHQKFGPRTVARQLLLDPIAAVKNRFASRSVFDGRVGGKAIPAAVKAERFERVRHVREESRAPVALTYRLAQQRNIWAQTRTSERHAVGGGACAAEQRGHDAVDVG